MTDLPKNKTFGGIRMILIFSLFFLTGIVLLSLLSFATIAVMEAVNPAPDPEYQRYLNIKNTSECTLTNDTYCHDRSICIHAYEYCQRQQCKEDFP